MSIDIVRINDTTVLARTHCDTCNVIIGERPAMPYEHAGTKLPVMNWCEKCARKFDKGLGKDIFKPDG